MISEYIVYIFGGGLVGSAIGALVAKALKRSVKTGIAVGAVAGAAGGFLYCYLRHRTGSAIPYEVVFRR